MSPGAAGLRASPRGEIFASRQRWRRAGTERGTRSRRRPFSSAAVAGSRWSTAPTCDAEGGRLDGSCHTVDGVSGAVPEPLSELAAGGLPRLRADRRGHLHRQRHPRLPRSGRRVDPRPGRREAGHPRLLPRRSGDPAPVVADAAGDCTTPTRSRTPGTGAGGPGAAGPVARPDHPEHRRPAPGGRLGPGPGAGDPRHRPRGRVRRLRRPDGDVRRARPGGRAANRIRPAWSAATS